MTAQHAEGSSASGRPEHHGAPVDGRLALPGAGTDAGRCPRRLAAHLPGCLASVLIAMAPMPARGQSPDTVAIGACRLETVGSATVSGIEDARTFRLADGRVARLAGIEVATAAEIAERAKHELESALVGEPVTLRRIGSDSDRYGRLLVHMFAVKDGAERWIQSELLSRGQALVGTRVGDRGCAAELLARERAARDVKLGLWTEPSYVMKRAENAASIAADDGRFAIVEGKVLSVRESSGTLYVNFGRRWSQDFAVIISKRNERSFAAGGLEPRQLEGRMVRVRGWVELRSGPAIEAMRPEQIEILDTRQKGM